MTLSATYGFGKRRIFDIKVCIQALRFLIINAILALIFLFLTLEEVDWAVFKSAESLTDKINDNTSWNIYRLF